MLNCQNSCLLCDLFQVYKVNFSKIHGFCIDHHEEMLPFQTCIHCKSTIMIISLTEIEHSSVSQASPILESDQKLAQESLLKNSPKTFLLQKSLQICEFCLEPSLDSQVTCHHICRNCFNESCPICTRLTCENCESLWVVNTLSCGHTICQDCNVEDCELCIQEAYFNCLKKQTSFNPQCEYCKENKFSITCDQNHRICSGCGKEGCPLCKVSINIVECENCRMKLSEEKCANQHFVCSDCKKDCALCQRDIFSSLHSEFNPRNSSGNIRSTLSDASRSQEIRRRRMSAESQSWARDPIINEASVSYENNLSQPPKKKITNKTAKVKSCIKVQLVLILSIKT